MSSEEQEEQNGKEGRAEEPQAAFKTVKIFSSFEEEAEYTAKQRAELSHGERLRHVRD
ncbi:MAG: hypothetical protein U5K31_06640 [Balneolaceae bacterium]|nr:hypothetical protein [Balneolaceae bacterium]